MNPATAGFCGAVNGPGPLSDHGRKNMGYCGAAGGAAAAGFISDRSGACVPHGCATTAEIEFCGEPLMNRSVHTTYTKLLCGASQNRLTCRRLNSTERFSVKASSP